MAATFAVIGCSGKVEQGNAALPPQKFLTFWSFSCSPVNVDADRFGPVSFETDFDVGTVIFKLPTAWRTQVEVVASPPQVPPERNLKWVTQSGKVLTGRIGWRDDATLNPDTFGVFLGMHADQVRWASWTCKATSINGSLPPETDANL